MPYIDACLLICLTTSSIDQCKLNQSSVLLRSTSSLLSALNRDACQFISVSLYYFWIDWQYLPVCWWPALSWDGPQCEWIEPIVMSQCLVKHFRLSPSCKFAYHSCDKSIWCYRGLCTGHSSPRAVSVHAGDEMTAKVTVHKYILRISLLHVCRVYCSFGLQQHLACLLIYVIWKWTFFWHNVRG